MNEQQQQAATLHGKGRANRERGSEGEYERWLRKREQNVREEKGAERDGELEMKNGEKRWKC